MKGRRSRIVPFAAALLCLAAVACGEPPDAAPSGASGGVTPTVAGNFTRRSYERSFVFASTEADSTFIVPWMMKTFEEPDSVTREARGWLARGGVWDAFYAERWKTPPSRSAARPVPHRGLQLLVRDNEAIDGLLFEQGPRSLEIVLGEARTSWTGARGGSFTVMSGSAFLVDQRIDGMILDVSRASGSEQAPGGDWAFLLSGDSAHFVFAADVEHGSDTQPAYRGWASIEGAETAWPEVRMEWDRTEAFPPARRDVPVEWRLWTSDDLLEGDLEAVSAEIQPGEGPGPLLPVLALFEVTGVVRTVQGDFPVQGVLVHERR